ncbi:MAG TPA: MBL fold metallo-hydrolase [Candidatus Saccharimonas sp.]|nr:MBL fold metallo-hydrolase [Candidatus Saccharimonas sp.]
MDITYLGAGSVKLSGKNITVVCDPYTEEAGLGKLNVKADVVTLSTMEGLASSAAAMVIDGPGEYEVKGAMITGVPAQLHIDEDGTRATVYGIMIDGINVVVTGNIAGKLGNEQTEALGNVDVLVVPVGGTGLTLDAAGAAAVVTQLEPSYVVPVHYGDGKTKYAMPQDGVELFLKEMGASPEPEPKLKLSGREETGETQVVVLKRSGE